MGDDLIEKALGLLCDKYIFPEKAAEAAAAVRARRAAGAYDGLAGAELGARLTADLAEVCADKHLRVRPREEDVREALTEEQMAAAYAKQLRRNNYGIARVERLDGNVGYLDLRQVPDASVGGRAIAAAMQLVTHTEALIVDLRKNRGGAPNGVIFWTSYFFSGDETHLNDIYDGASGVTRQFWSLAHLPGERYLDRPVYVLTSDVTFSAGEEFCYNLQAQGRATLIGATTRGGAHPTEFFPLSPTMEITVPIARAVNPVTGTNWEGTGVVPDVQMPAAEAFAYAYEKALRHVIATGSSAAVLEEARAALPQA
ncbi:S41 family peptidase [Actinoplanes sp. NPDC049681]|uniref:S41 family peptidase n=1 Tax=Actinoplanes sp. NPDC049681 TaxID=3363905 RepID=UPI0037BD5DFA